MSWKNGPLPPKTYGFGGVVPVGLKTAGFYFADFRGDTVKAVGLINNATGEDFTILTAEQVAQYDNSLELPPQKGAHFLEL